MFSEPRSSASRRNEVPRELGKLRLPSEREVDRTAVRAKLKKDWLWILGGTAIIAIMLKVLFSLAPVGVIAKLVGGVLWLFVLPGYCIMLPWQKELELKERVVVGMLAAAGLFAILSYYLGLAGLHISMHTWLFPPIVVLATAVLLWYKRH